MPGSFHSSRINTCVLRIGVFRPRFIVFSKGLGLHKMWPPRGFAPGTSRMSSKNAVPLGYSSPDRDSQLSVTSKQKRLQPSSGCPRDTGMSENTNVSEFYLFYPNINNEIWRLLFGRVFTVVQLYDNQPKTHHPTSIYHYILRSSYRWNKKDLKITVA